jgi:integrase
LSEAEISHMTLSQHMERWLRSVRQSVRASTHRRYTDVVSHHILPHLGTTELAKLSALQVQNLYDDKADAGLSVATIELIHNVLHKALKQAVRWELLNRNVTDLVDKPTPRRPKRIVWNECQAAAFLAVSDQDEWAALWRLALLTGMRRGEILGLQWADVDLERARLTVQRTYSQGADGRFEFGEPKSESGNRVIALPRSVIESLQRHRVRQLQTRLKMGSAYVDRKLVFADHLGGPLCPGTLRYRYMKLIGLAGVPIIRFHDLRHTSATLMMGNGEHPKVVSERLGHATVSITMDLYSHVSLDMQQAAADRLEARVGGAS